MFSTIGMLVLSTLAIVTLMIRLALALNRYSFIQGATPRNTHTPSISVCIAARNEMHALTQCLEQVLASDYEKLEILVLDDASDDNTSMIIKSFASAGVRFVASRNLPEGWTGKNHAYNTLLSEASGDYVVFMDVDTTLRINTLSQLMSVIRMRNRSMLSVLPFRNDAYRLSAMFGTLRYVWELVLASKSTPPAASAFWMIERNAALSANYDLTNFKASFRPERHFASRLQKSDGYEYLIGTKGLGVGYEKRLSSQHATAFRLYYVLTGKNVVTAFLGMLFLLLLLAPCAAFTSQDAFVRSWAAALYITMMLWIAGFTYRTRRTPASLVASILWPLFILQELVLLTGSTIAHRLGLLRWKGRKIYTSARQQSKTRL